MYINIWKKKHLKMSEGSFGGGEKFEVTQNNHFNFT